MRRGFGDAGGGGGEEKTWKKRIIEEALEEGEVLRRGESEKNKRAQMLVIGASGVWLEIVPPRRQAPFGGEGSYHMLWEWGERAS
jgi:hypothetical protein